MSDLPLVLWLPLFVILVVVGLSIIAVLLRLAGLAVGLSFFTISGLLRALSGDPYARESRRGRPTTRTGSARTPPRSRPAPKIERGPVRSPATPHSYSTESADSQPLAQLDDDLHSALRQSADLASALREQFQQLGEDDQREDGLRRSVEEAERALAAAEAAGELVTLEAERARLEELKAEYRAAMSAFPESEDYAERGRELNTAVRGAVELCLDPMGAELRRTARPSAELVAALAEGHRDDEELAASRKEEADRWGSRVWDAISDVEATELVAEELREWAEVIDSVDATALGSPYALAVAAALDARGSFETARNVESLGPSLEPSPIDLWVFSRTMLAFAWTLEHNLQTNAAMLAELLGREALRPILIMSTKLGFNQRALIVPLYKHGSEAPTS